MFSYGLWDTLGARGFSCAVSGFGHVLQNDPRERASQLVSSAFGRRNEAPRRTREKTSTGGSGGYLIAE